MKIESNVVVPKPVLESVTITLTPREAVLLMCLVGNMKPGEAVSTINHLNHIAGVTDIFDDIDAKILGLTSKEEVDKSILPIYWDLERILCGFKKVA